MSNQIQKVDVTVRQLQNVINSLPTLQDMRNKYRRPEIIQRRIITPMISPMRNDETIRMIELEFFWEVDQWILKDTTL